MQKLIYLNDFRRRNGLSQSELAQDLSVSTSFISMVETGNSRLTAEKMKIIWDLSTEKGWLTDELVPAFTRLGLLDAYITCDDHLSEDDKNRFRMNLNAVIPQKAFDAIKYGQMGIDSTLAERIISIAPKGNIPMKPWLMSGEGPMFLNSAGIRNSAHNDEWKNDNEEILILLKKIAEKLDKLEGKINNLASNGDRL